MKKPIIAVLIALAAMNAAADTSSNYAFGQLGAGVSGAGIFDDFLNSYSTHSDKFLVFDWLLRNDSKISHIMSVDMMAKASLPIKSRAARLLSHRK